MIKRTNRRVWCIAVITALFLMTVLLLFIMTDGAKVAYADELEEPTTLDNYLLNEYKNEISFDKPNRIINVSGDDNIVEYVPKEHFMQEGQHLYIGDDYGYYIYTFPDGKFENPNGKFTSFGNMRSIVLGTLILAIVGTARLKNKTKDKEDKTNEKEQ